MSDWYRLVCLSEHSGGANVSDDVGNHNAGPASMVMRNRKNIVQLRELLAPLDIGLNDVAHGHWDNNVIHAIMFVADHPECEIELQNEAGDHIPFDDDPDPHDGPDKFCPKCRGRLGRTSIKVGYGHMLELAEPTCFNEKIDRARLAFVYWFEFGYEVARKFPDPSIGMDLDEHVGMKKMPGYFEGYQSARQGVKIPVEKVKARAHKFYAGILAIAEREKAEQNS